MPLPPPRERPRDSRRWSPTSAHTGIRVAGTAKSRDSLPAQSPARAPARPAPASSGPPAAPLREFHTYWCNTPGPCIQTAFVGDWVLPLVEGGRGAATKDRYNRRLVTVRGLCPFHVIAVRNSDNSASCGGINTHVHEPTGHQAGTEVVVTSAMPQLSVPLVTTPIPLSALLQFAALRRVAMYTFKDAAWLDTVVKRSAPPGAESPPIITLRGSAQGVLTLNPVCRRMLERLAHEKQWRLDESAHFSIDMWTNNIGQDNVLLFLRGLRVPCPQDARFKAPTDTYRVAVGFWTPFQRQMWDYFLEHSTGPCYLDAAYRCDRDGFQLWTLLFERSGQVVPVAYLVTTAATVSLVADWLEAIVNHYPDPLPAKTLYVNSLRLVSVLTRVLDTWDVKLCKYYIDQMLKDALRRKPSLVKDPDAVLAVQNTGSDFGGALKVATAVFKDELAYMFSQVDNWAPSTTEEVPAFMQGSQVVSRWRYLLWTQMLGREPTARVDSVLYHLHSVLTPGVAQAVQAVVADRLTVGDFGTEQLEQGSGSLIEDLKLVTLVPMGGSLVYAVKYSNVTHSAAIATDYNVCFCRTFGTKGMCRHLIHWATPMVHQPELIQLLDGLPHA
ncbi:hypothetical protein IWQ57_001525 [Coemansia nantahalensis]|uniref:Uncharacterized protein n=1 Tax=Coemansia nantahalensis TaxID=2789366 RepID=A0ACC1K3N1_9FUNG|nr:hypothetical protein IWQ57_001525 [Coemansia nantahalensis]